MNIRVHIERLVLDGLPVTHGQGPLVQGAVEAELTRLLAERGLDRSALVVPDLSAGSIAVNAETQPTHLARQIAQAVSRGLSATAAPHARTPSRRGTRE